MVKGFELPVGDNLKGSMFIIVKSGILPVSLFCIWSCMLDICVFWLYYVLDWFSED